MKTALILGGTSDIGLSVATLFASRGWSLVLTGRNEGYLNRIAADIRLRTHTNVKSVYFDAVDFDSHRTFYESLTPPPDLCICIFGYLGDQTKAFYDWKEAERIIDVNYRGAVSILNLVASDFATRGRGTIIGISSVAGDRGRQSNFIYGSAKGAFSIYLAGLRNYLHPLGVKVITVKPGYVETRMTENINLPRRLTASPDQVAKEVFNAYKRQKNTLYVLGIWRPVMWVIRMIPERIFKRLKL